MWSSDNFPMNARTFQEELPDTTLTLDLVHMEKRLTSTLRQCAITAQTTPLHTARHSTLPRPPRRTSGHRGRVQADWANNFLVLRQGSPNGPPEPHSVESIKDRLRRGAVTDKSRVMIKRGKHGTAPVFFKFNTNGPATELSGAHTYMCMCMCMSMCMCICPAYLC
jgi:hypothetical protein